MEVSKVYSISKINIIFFVIIALFPLFTLSSQQDTTPKLFEIEVSKDLLGTVVEAKVVHEDINYCKKALYLAFREIERIDSTYSLQNENSLLNKINRSAGIAPVKVDEEFMTLIQMSLYYSNKYDDLFDITVGPLTELWGFSSDDKIKIPSENEIKEKLALVGYRNIEFNEFDVTVYLKKKGMILDLGGIAKGLAVDAASKTLKENGIDNFMINAGGDLYVSGHNKYLKPWSLGIKHPRKNDELIASFETTNIAVATSGDYERYAIINGNRYHHILYPSTGMPGNLCRSVTVLYNNTEEATVIGKYIFLLGVKKFLETKLSKKLNYFIIDNNGKQYWNDKFKKDNNLELFNK